MCHKRKTSFYPYAYFFLKSIELIERIKYNDKYSVVADIQDKLLYTYIYSTSFRSLIQIINMPARVVPARIYFTIMFTLTVIVNT